MKNIMRVSGIASALFGILACAPLAAQAASVSVSGVPVGAITASTTISFSVSETGFADPTYSVSDSYSGSGATTGTVDKSGYYTWTPGIYDGGWHTLTFSATDLTNAVATTSVRILVAATHVFAQNLAPGATVAVGRALTFTAYAPGFNMPAFTVYDGTAGSSVTPGAMNASTGAFSWTPTGDDIGTHTLTIRASDINGNTAQTSVTVSVIAPKVSVASYQPSIAAGSLSIFTASATGITNPAWSVVDYPSGGATSTSVVASDVSSAGVFSWIPRTSDIGTHAVNIIATDSYGNTASTTLSLFVTPATGGATAPATTIAPSSSATTTPAAATALPATAAPVSAASAAATVFQFNAYLGIGSKGAGVTALQQLLAQSGLYSGPITGYFGALTRSAVAAFQKAHGISPVGYVGPSTRAALNASGSASASSTPSPTMSRLTASQVSSILGMLESFNVDAATIAQVRTILGGQ